VPDAPLIYSRYLAGYGISTAAANASNMRTASKLFQFPVQALPWAQFSEQDAAFKLFN